MRYCVEIMNTLISHLPVFLIYFNNMANQMPVSMQSRFWQQILVLMRCHSFVKYFDIKPVLMFCSPHEMIWPEGSGWGYSAIIYYTGGVFQWTCTYHDKRTYERTTENIIFDLGVRKYVRVNDYDLWPGFYVTDHNYNWPIFRVGIFQVNNPALANTSTF